MGIHKLLAAALLAATVAVAPVWAQDPLSVVDLNSPEMSEAEMTRADVEKILKAASAEKPADFTAKRMGVESRPFDIQRFIQRRRRPGIHGNSSLSVHQPRSIHSLGIILIPNHPYILCQPRRSNLHEVATRRHAIYSTARFSRT